MPSFFLEFFHFFQNWPMLFYRLSGRTFGALELLEIRALGAVKLKVGGVGGVGGSGKLTRLST
jgi:hypothetical protein